MESYCFKCRKYIENINPQVSSTSNGKVIKLSKYAMYNSRKSILITQQEVKVLLSK